MSRLGVPHLIFSIVAIVFFAAMGILALPFPPTAQWFPLYTSIFGVLISLAAAIMCLVAVLRARRASTAQNASVPVGAAEASGHQATLETEGIAVLDLDEDDAVLSDPDDERGMTARGFAWLGVWLGFVLVGLLIGYVSASAIWIGVWFRTVHKWRWRIVVPLVAVIVALLLLAQIQLNIKMPGFDWIKSVFRW